MLTNGLQLICGSEWIEMMVDCGLGISNLLGRSVSWNVELIPNPFAQTLKTLWSLTYFARRLC